MLSPGHQFMKFITPENLVLLLPAIVGVLYLITGLLYFLKRDYAWATVWTAYAIANMGLILVSIGHK